MNTGTDFSRFFQDDFSFQYDYQDGGQPPHTGLQDVTISVCEIGNLNLPLAALDLSLAALEKFDREFCSRAIVELEKNTLNGWHTANWANVLVNGTTEANVIAFSSGRGDGGYSSYWGYDQKIT